MTKTKQDKPKNHGENYDKSKKDRNKLIQDMEEQMKPKKEGK